MTKIKINTLIPLLHYKGDVKKCASVFGYGIVEKSTSLHLFFEGIGKCLISEKWGIITTNVKNTIGEVISSNAIAAIAEHNLPKEYTISVQTSNQYRMLHETSCISVCVENEYEQDQVLFTADIFVFMPVIDLKTLRSLISALDENKKRINQNNKIAHIILIEKEDVSTINWNAWFKTMPCVSNSLVKDSIHIVSDMDEFKKKLLEFSQTEIAF